MSLSEPHDPAHKQERVNIDFESIIYSNKETETNIYWLLLLQFS